MKISSGIYGLGQWCDTNVCLLRCASDNPRRRSEMASGCVGGANVLTWEIGMVKPRAYGAPFRFEAGGLAGLRSTW